MLENQLTVHFHSRKGNYEAYDMWKWLDGYWGEDAYFTEQDDFGLVGYLTYPAAEFLPKVYLLVKTGDWSFQTCDYAVQRFVGDAPNEIWLVEGDEQVYYSKQVASTSPAYTHQDETAFDMGIRSDDFDYHWAYQGWLGSRYQKEQTEFKVWAPLADRVYLLLYPDDRKPAQIIPMMRGREVNSDHHELNTHGVWSTLIKEDIKGYAYQYRVYHEKDFYQDTRDPYSFALTLDNQKTLIVDQKDLIPQDFRVQHGTQALWRTDNPCSAVISELHIRDLTKDSSSGVDEALRGTFLGACQSGTYNDFGDATAFDYLKDMGYSYVQLQPVFDHHKTYSDTGELHYNWGYDPENYNVPDRQFAVDQTNPLAPILEFKEMIQAYHDAGIGVIMDVVYNHTYSSYNSPFQLTVPFYYYRMASDGTFQNGSGCGNETASEKEMYRKYMLDSIRYWVEAYNIDGFRFDLMGLHDVETMNAIRDLLDSIDPNILLYGEGWDMGTGLAPLQKASKSNINQLPRIAVFNDNARDAVKGAEVYGDIKTGFVSGAPLEKEVSLSLLGSKAFSSYLAPNQVLNYIEAHDNYNLNDLLAQLHPEDSVEARKRRIYLANRLNLSMQGICFMQLGQEFMRTKIYPTGENKQVTADDLARASNSYNAPDTVNAIDWNLVTQHKDLVRAVQQLIAKKEHQRELSLETYEEIEQEVVIKSAEYESGIVEMSWNRSENSSIIFNNYTDLPELF